MRSHNADNDPVVVRYPSLSGEAEGRLVLPTIGHEANAREAEDHHGPGRWFGDGVDLQGGYNVGAVAIITGGIGVAEKIH
jgi:hypothetical protein